MGRCTIENVLQADIENAKMNTRKVVFMMANKSSNVAARVEPEIKEEAEAILTQLGIKEFDAKMARGLAQASAGEGVSADEFFASLRQEILRTYD